MKSYYVCRAFLWKGLDLVFIVSLKVEHCLNFLELHCRVLLNHCPHINQQHFSSSIKNAEERVSKKCFENWRVWTNELFGQNNFTFLAIKEKHFESNSREVECNCDHWVVRRNPSEMHLNKWLLINQMDFFYMHIFFFTTQNKYLLHLLVSAS